MYQRMTNKIFKHHIERNVEVYIDDIIVNNRMTNS